MADNSRTIELASIECCHGLLFYDSGGPNAYYGPNENRTYTFLAPVGQRIRVEFLPIESHQIGPWDTLFLYDGNSTSAPLIRYITNSPTRPASFTTTGNSLAVRFKSDGSLDYPGWAMRISCQAAANCSFNMGTSGSINLNTQGCCAGANFYDSGGPDNGYSSGFRGTYTVQAAPGQRIEVIFTYAFLGSGSSRDTLRIYDGPNTSAPLLGEYTENQLPPRITSSGNALTFRLEDRNSSGSTGWAAWLRCLGTGTGPTSLTAGEARSLVIYPNPSPWGATIRGEQLIRRAVVLDITGRQIQELQAQGLQLTIPPLPAGIYTIEVELEGGQRHHLRWVAQ
ncbi:MAG: CUB domain-containing protein [Bacteroidia bacterium]|nr:CUB domain-containing protein [Bacteroidia bacterium]